MEKLIQILKQQLIAYHITDIIQVGDRELNLVVSTRETARDIKRLADIIHDDSEIVIKGIKINFVDQYGTPFSQL